MDDFTPNPANYTMKGARATPQPAFDVSRLEGMSNAELIAIIRLCSPALVDAKLLTKEERAERLRLKIYSIAMGSGRDADTLKAANDWLDREEGKPVQRIANTHELGESFFERRARELERGRGATLLIDGGAPPGLENSATIIPPPSKFSQNQE